MILIRYKHSKLASIISSFGAAFVIMGFYLLGCALGFVSASEGTGSVAGDVLGGIALIVVGAVVMFVASEVAASKEVKYQEKMKAKTEAKLAKAEAKAAAGTDKKMGMGQKARNCSDLHTDHRAYFQYFTGKSYLGKSSVSASRISSRDVYRVFPAGDHWCDPASQRKQKSRSYRNHNQFCICKKYFNLYQ